MKQLLKAQLTIGLIACFSLAWGLFQQALNSTSLATGLLIAVLQLVAILVLSYVLLALLEWVKIFDLKTNAIITLITMVTIRISYVIVV